MKPASLFENSFAQLYSTSNGQSLKWRHDLQIGYLPSVGFDYSGDYWENYKRLRATPMGEELNNFRTGFVRFVLGERLSAMKVCDVGIGSGHFVETLPCYGFDVNNQAVEWLREKGQYLDPHHQIPDVLTFWDSIEHIDDPSPLLATVKHVFMSIPICRTVKEWLQSKHFKPNEHIWYFTEEGLKTFMTFYGYNLVCKSDGETRIGREDIMSYYFHK